MESGLLSSFVLLALLAFFYATHKKNTKTRAGICKEAETR